MRGAGFEPASLAYEASKVPLLYPAIYIGPFTVLPRTADSQLDYPLFQEFSDDSFSFSVISFTNTSLLTSLVFYLSEYLNRLCCSISMALSGDLCQE